MLISCTQTEGPWDVGFLNDEERISSFHVLTYVLM